MTLKIFINDGFLGIITNQIMVYMNEFQKTVKGIKELKIQGAQNIRNKAVQAIKHTIQTSSAKNEKEFLLELKKNLRTLFESRPTEPGMQEALREIWEQAQIQAPLQKLKEKIVKLCEDYEIKRKKDAEKIAEFGAKIFHKKSVVLTHCHSKNVTNTIKLAFDKGRISKV
ncbi:MAG: hypothetical protein Q7K42_06300, partial [Candidatus Diapherotrites archaeon]|nr:hypothetical protein [Candidatus Diapherotrites archaeon]